MKKVVFITLMLLSLTCFKFVYAMAQDTAIDPPMAAYGADGNLWLYGFEDEPIQITFQEGGLSKILWHPGGPLHELPGIQMAFILHLSISTAV